MIPFNYSPKVLHLDVRAEEYPMFKYRDKSIQIPKNLPHPEG
jgi:hypothetical protein